MLVSHPKRDFGSGGKHDYYFVNQFGGLSLFQSEERLQVDSLIYLSSIGDYLFKVTGIDQEGDKRIVTFKSVKAIICDQPFPFGSF
ncbi:hypothetical protein [Niallia circulans]|uniref:hypothetical protein n=1 Tax=Niallia circulans TaxID=1397 RepID=UPI001F32A5AE|nr:hypothetical protein [Niallia circulans]MCF2650593.1 hypothetical protein [Niallia circulans]